MKKILLATAILAALAPAARADHDTVWLIGKVVRECGFPREEYALQLEESFTRYPMVGASFCHLNAKRVEVAGRLVRDCLTVESIHELLDRCEDLVVTVDVRYGGPGELYVGYMPAGWFVADSVRFPRRVACGDRVQVRIAVRREDEQCGARYQVVLVAAERKWVSFHGCTRPIVTLRHAASGTFTLWQGQWTDGHRRVGQPPVSLCL